MSTRVIASLNSTAEMPAKEVLRLAALSLQEIRDQRTRTANAAWDLVKDQKCSHFGGLWKHKRYPTREHAERFSPEFKLATSAGHGDYNTCQVLANFANKLLDLDPNAKMTITADDFRAIS